MYTGYVRICLAAINKTLFSWLGQKTKRSMRCSHGHGMTPCPGKTSRYRSVFSILIIFEATEYSYSIRFFFEISRIFDSNEITDSSVPHFIFRQIADNVHFSFRQSVKKISVWRKPSANPVITGPPIKQPLEWPSNTIQMPCASLAIRKS